jgi:acyl-coenzyme A synthetase/AMP-(fatty) acid ligase
MEVLEDLVARDRRSEATALRVPAVGRSYDYRGFCTAAWKVGNLLRHLGVRHGSGVAIGDDPMPEAVLTLYGAACLGAVVRFDARPDPGGPPLPDGRPGGRGRPLGHEARGLR